MKIKEITSQSRRDFYAIYECEHCGHTERGSGYDDDNFHRNVIPKWECNSCGKTSAAEYRSMGTKYAANEVI